MSNLGFYGILGHILLVFPVYVKVICGLAPEKVTYFVQQASMSAIIGSAEPEEPEETVPFTPVIVPDPEEDEDEKEDEDEDSAYEEELDEDATQRFSNLQFGRDYEIK